jgi:hypothetical protein
MTNLDALVAACKAARLKEASGQWAFASAVAEINRTGAWKQRLRADRSPAYGRWVDFCKAELGISPTHSYDLIAIAETLSLELIQQFGLTKAILVTKVPAGGERVRMIKMIERGASVHCLRQHVIASRRLAANRGKVVPITKHHDEMLLELYRWCARASSTKSLDHIRRQVQGVIGQKRKAS